MDQHKYSFFGQKTGMVISNPSSSDPNIFMTMIKRKKEGVWEKTAEGKTIKLNIPEIISIYDVLMKIREKWNIFHSFNGIKTPISFAWDEHDSDLLWINVDDYSRPLNYPETKLMQMLIGHILTEKIENATGGGDRDRDRKGSKCDSDLIPSEIGSSEDRKLIPPEPQRSQSQQYQKIEKKKNEKGEGHSVLKGCVKINREKAVLVQRIDGAETWLPKSTILSDVNYESSEIQEFTVKSWVLEKRG